MLRSEFYALMLMTLMVLHNAEGHEMEDAMAEVANCAQADAYLSPQVCRRAFGAGLRLSRVHVSRVGGKY